MIIIWTFLYWLGMMIINISTLPNTFDQLLPEIQRSEILPFLDSKDLASFSQTSKTIYLNIQEQILWNKTRNFYQICFGKLDWEKHYQTVNPNRPNWIIILQRLNNVFSLLPKKHIDQIDHDNFWNWIKSFWLSPKKDHEDIFKNSFDFDFSMIPVFTFNTLKVV